MLTVEGWAGIGAAGRRGEVGIKAIVRELGVSGDAVRAAIRWRLAAGVPTDQEAVGH